MKNTFTILCPTDFSECSLNAIEYAARLGEKYEAELILFHVLNQADYLKIAPLDPHGNNQLDFITEKLSNLKNAVEQESLSKGLKSCVIAHRTGKIVEETITYSKEIAADLIVIGTEGINDLRKNMIGSRASRIVELIEVDVLVVPRRVFFKIPKKLVYASDYLEEDKLAIQKIVEVAKFYGSEVDLLHVSLAKRAIEKSLHETMIEEISPFINYEKVNFVLKSYLDDLALAIESYLNASKGDILFTLSIKRSFFEKIFTNSVSKKMAYFINKPLWVIKSF